MSLLKNGIPSGSSLDTDIREISGIESKKTGSKLLELSFAEGLPDKFSPSQLYECEYILDQNSPLNYTVPMFLNFDQITVKNILSACRINKVKLQSYIILVYVHTINQICPGLYKGKYLKTSVAASLRNRSTLHQSHNSYLGNTGRFDDGFYSYAATFFLEPNLSFTWDAVRKYHGFLHRRLSKEISIEQLPTAQEIKGEETANIPTAKRKDDLFFLCTNLGHLEVIHYEDRTKFQIDDFLFAASAGAVLGTHHMTVTSTRKSGLNIGFTNGDPNIKDWALFKKAFSENLVAFLQDQRPSHL